MQSCSKKPAEFKNQIIFEIRALRKKLSNYFTIILPMHVRVTRARFVLVVRFKTKIKLFIDVYAKTNNSFMCTKQ